MELKKINKEDVEDFKQYLLAMWSPSSPSAPRVVWVAMRWIPSKQCFWDDEEEKAKIGIEDPVEIYELPEMAIYNA